MRCALALGLTMGPIAAAAQGHAPDVRTPDSVTVAAGAHYKAGGLRRLVFGGTYRDLWTTPIRVPVLNLRTVEGGLTPVKAGGGHQTKSLRLRTAGGVEYVFRSVDKDDVSLGPDLEDVGIARSIGLEEVPTSHPAANLVGTPFYEAVGILHESPVLVVMPDDALLGKFRKEFAHRLGTLARYPANVDADSPGFAGAIEIIDSDTLLHRLNRAPEEHVNATAFLTARLIDFLINNYDRDPQNWKWARLRPLPEGAWEPIPRDLDDALVSRNGLIVHLLASTSSRLISFDSTYPGLAGMTNNSFDMDKRLLAGLAKPVWDSIAHFVMTRVTNDVIDAAMLAMPAEYRASTPAIAAKLRARRDALPMMADRFYDYLTGVMDIHGTEAPDRAVVTRVDGRFVDVGLETTEGRIYFQRRFDAREFSALRIYLHDGDDQAVILGDVPSSIPIRIIGGNGNNRLVDSSTVGGHRNAVRLYDVGMTHGVSYGVDTLFDRRPSVREFGRVVEPSPDHGAKMSPIVGLSSNHDAGLVPRLGMTRYTYGFRDAPYASMLSIEGRYSFKIGGSQIEILADQRHESSPWHVTEFIRMSQLELINYHGLGNDSPESAGLAANVTAPRTDYYSVNQRQWVFQPAIALALGERTDLSFGPVFRYAVTDSLADRFISATRPYGDGHFGEAGVRLSLIHDSREPARHAHHGTDLDVSGTYYPGVWDVRSAFGVLDAAAAAYVTLPVPLHPYLALRGGAKKVFGEFPFEESAFIGGRLDVRTLDLQRYAGDASLYATAEMRVPVATFSLVLPLNVGLLGTGDMGRVYVHGDSPGGWHNALGAGFWVAFRELSIDIRMMHSYDTPQPAGIAMRFAIPGVLP